MWIRYNPESDILTIRLDTGQDQFRNEFFRGEVAEVVFDIDSQDRIASIDTLKASKRVNLPFVRVLAEALP